MSRLAIAGVRIAMVEAKTSSGSDDQADSPQVRYEPGRGWMCSCTGVWSERVDFDLDCHHWPLCEHVVKAAKQRREEAHRTLPLR